MEKFIEIPKTGLGDLSDGYHTFNQLYHQRAVLFAVIVKQNKDLAWKSFKHEDGQYCFDSDGEWFIVGIDTPEGSYTYHYEKKYWDMFDCIELESVPLLLPLQCTIRGFLSRRSRTGCNSRARFARCSC